MRASGSTELVRKSTLRSWDLIWPGGGSLPLPANCSRDNGALEPNIYEIIGEEGFTRMIRAFYAQVPDDEILGPMYPADDLDGAEQRLRDFLIGRFGGPQRYIEQQGHPRLRMRHGPFAIDQRARDRWMELMTKAVADAELPEEVQEFMLHFFGGTATFMINR